MISKKLVLLFSVLTCIRCYSQKDGLPDSLRQLAVAARYHSGFIFAHSIRVQNTKGVKPDGLEFEYSHLRTDSATHAYFKCYPRSGFSFTYVDFNQWLLGKSYSISYFLEPNYKLGNRLRMNLRASSGFSYLTNPFDSIKNPTNQTYSGHINMFLQLGIGFAYPLSKHFDVYTMANFFHNSNGGFTQPNSGLNYINASLGLKYYNYSSRLPVYKKVKDSSWKQKPAHFDISIYYSPKSGYTPDSIAQRKFVIGGSVQIVKQVGNIDALTAAAEIYYDDGLRSIKKIFLEDSSSSSVLAGVLIGHQFLLNRFTFSQQLGFYVFKQTDQFNERYTNLYHTIYHRWGVSYKLHEHWSVGINFLAHNQIADFIDGRVIYRLK
jgi:hypothetical protein